MRQSLALLVSLVAVPASAEPRANVETAAVQSRISSVRSCWERAVREEPTPSKATLAIEVDAEGTVTNVTVDPLPARLVTCIAGRVRTWHFPSGGTRQLSYPIGLSADEK